MAQAAYCGSPLLHSRNGAAALSTTHHAVTVFFFIPILTIGIFRSGSILPYFLGSRNKFYGNSSCFTKAKVTVHTPLFRGVFPHILCGNPELAGTIQLFSGRRLAYGRRIFIFRDLLIRWIVRRLLLSGCQLLFRRSHIAADRDLAR